MGATAHLKEYVPESELDEADRSWIQQAQQIRLVCGVEEDLDPYTDCEGVTIRGITGTRREKELLNLAYIRQNDSLNRMERGGCKKFDDEPFVWQPYDDCVEENIPDLSQNPRQKSFGRMKGHGRNSKHYFMKRQSALFEEETFFPFGYDQEEIFDDTQKVAFTATEYLSLSGDAYAKPVVGTMYVAMLTNIEYPGLWERDPDISRPSLKRCNARMQLHFDYLDAANSGNSGSSSKPSSSANPSKKQRSDDDDVTGTQIQGEIDNEDSGLECGNDKDFENDFSYF